tara:strand:+ start:44 stop:277 length:234 start_codon:yes stop_codon:yes gene_type:complete
MGDKKKMTRILMGVAFGCSFVFMILGIIFFIYLNKILGIMLLIIGGLYFFKYLPSNNKEYLKENTYNTIQFKLRIKK